MTTSAESHEPNWVRFFRTWQKVMVMVLATGVAATAAPTFADDPDPFEELRLRIEKLERDNQRLQERENERESQATFRLATSVPPGPENEDGNSIPDVAPPDADDLTQQRLSALESTMERLRNSLQFGTINPDVPRSTDIAPIPKAVTPAAPTYPSVRLTGFFQLDGGDFNQSGGNQHQFGTIPNDLGFRRARLAAIGDVSRNVSYMLEMDFAFPGRPSFMDVWLDVHDVALFGNVRAGQWRQPFGMDELTSARELLFIERPLVFGMTPFRQTGIGFHDNNEDATLTWASSIYGSETDAWGDVYGNKGFGSATRITGLPVFECDGTQLVHLGFDYLFTVPGPNGVCYRNVPEYGGPFGNVSQSVPGGTTGGGTGGDVPFIYNTGALFFNQSNMFNVELAGVYNQLHVQSELTYNVMNFGGTTATIPAAYIQTGYFLTGEVRPYNKVAGVLTRIKPLRPFGDCGGFGAWELTARYSYIDTNSVAPFGKVTANTPMQVGPGGAIPFGGAANDLTTGLNWYLNTYTKVQFNYIIANINRGGVSSVLDILAIRAQLDF